MKAILQSNRPAKPNPLSAGVRLGLRLLGLGAVCLLASSRLEAQAPAAVATEAVAEVSPLQQLENTYETELKKIHLPLINGYISNLKAIAAQSQSSEATMMIENELKAIQEVIINGGVMDLAASAALLNPPKVETAPVAPSIPSSIRRMNNRLISLTLDQATQKAADGVLTKASWTLASLPKGEVEVILQTAVTQFEIPVEVIAKLGDQQISSKIEERHQTLGADSVRMLSLGRFVVAEDLKDAVLEMELSPASTTLQLLPRQVILSVKE
jgi:hypothetical protein